MGTTAQAQDKSDVTITIPSNFRATHFVCIDDTVIVHARLNDTVDCNFVLDTGGYTSVTQAVASQLGLKLKQDKEGASIGACAPENVLDQVAIEGVELTDVPVQLDQAHYAESWNSAHPSVQIAGVLGIDVIHQWAIGIDFPSHTLGWWKGGKVTEKDIEFFAGIQRYPEKIKGALLMLAPGKSTVISGKTVTNKKLLFPTATKIPMVSATGVDQFFVSARLDGKATELGLNTGSNIISVPEAVAKGLHPLFRKHAILDGSKAPFQVDAALFSTLTLGSLPFDLPVVGIVLKSPQLHTDTPADTPLLGLNLFTDCRIVMDFPGRALYLHPYADYRETILQRLKRSGIGVHRMENSRDLLSVFPHSPGAAVGMKSGDELLTINGQSLTTILENPGAFPKRKSLLLRLKRKGVQKALEIVLPTSG